MPESAYRLNVEELPRRMAHALHALLTCEHDDVQLPTAQEVVIYDEEAISARATAAALREAANRGLCMYVPPGHWTPMQDLWNYRGELEDRYLRETERPGDG